MKSFTPIDLGRRSFTALRCVYLLLMLLVAGGSLYVLIALSHNLWLAGFLLLVNGLMIYVSLIAKDSTQRNIHETLQSLGQIFG
ncbi:hypothetical protein [Pseudomonas sp. PDM11]|jgi:fatty acid desaturase|uniref:hypothetical protein n=1 Tax=Pseudomonas sp. PDM11 TaxID=2769309 RepID=UPI00177FFF71|nr:hypothetical protein [Pseudomonas sp. PDM11]MBD9397321.1 hypothetical protein [Pseudomonas sp. PDM11]